MTDFFKLLNEIKSKTLKLPSSLIWWGLGSNFLTYIIYNNYLSDIITKKNYIIISLSLTIVIVIFLFLYNFYFYFGKKNKKNIIINLYSEDRKIDQFVYNIKSEIEAILNVNDQNDVNVIVPNYCRRQNFTKSFFKKIRNKTDLTKSLVYKIYNKLWNAQIIIFGELKERQNINQKIVINNKIFVDIRSLKENQIQRINKLTQFNSKKDLFFVLDKDKEYVECKNFSCSLIYFAKYYLGIGYFMSDNITASYQSHKFIIENCNDINNFTKLDKLFYLESLCVIDDYIDSENYNKALECVNFLLDHKIQVNNTIFTKMSVMMYSTKNIEEYNYNVKECIKLSKSIKTEYFSHGILTKAYLELCRGNYETALKKYYIHFSSIKDVSANNFLDVIKYCNAAKKKEYEKETATFCLACIYLGIGDSIKFKENFSCLDRDKQTLIRKSNLYNLGNKKDKEK